MQLFPRDPEVFKRPSVISLLVVNALPLLGVLFLGWDMFILITIYWLETAVIGLFTLVKIAILSRIGALFMVPFFTVYMGGFMAGHWVFLSAFFGPKEARGDPIACLSAGLSNQEVLFMLAFLFLSHGVSFIQNFWKGPVRGGYDPGNPVHKKDVLGAVIFEPYGRIVVMHIAIIFGAMLTVIFGSSRAMFALLVLLKTAADLKSHLKLHSGNEKLGMRN